STHPDNSTLPPQRVNPRTDYRFINVTRYAVFPDNDDCHIYFAKITHSERNITGLNTARHDVNMLSA
ncbi:TPA: hypothetical protein ACIVAW_004572, partial [Salmonella enterica subsp. enterica serovar Javiana]